ncbi:uncharacterized protein LOC134754958 isoform X2 [Cydia strobilella]|uniref:uncharacterized protein LOC134754958 isoform X2 n=1 Tax=Cydia strobilella TaxID=1100964 RepID=UPI003003B271
MFFSILGCSCGDNHDSKVDNIQYDDGTVESMDAAQHFPSSDQIWGMVGTILAVGAVWMIFTSIKRGRKAPPHPPPRGAHGTDKQQPLAASRLAPLKQDSQRETQTPSVCNKRCK